MERALDNNVCSYLCGHTVVFVPLNFYCEVVECGALCGLRMGCKNRPAPFPGRMAYKATKPGLVLFYILACLFGPLLCIVNFSLYVFCILVVLVKLSLVAK